jgi:uncharacterized protein (DUF2141 family)
MVKNVLLGFATVALAVASAASSYHVTFYLPVTINGAQLQAGDYKLELKDDNTAILKQGKTVTEARVKVENDSQKYSRNTVRVNGSQVEEIRLGGTSKRLVFEKPGNATN